MARRRKTSDPRLIALRDQYEGALDRVVRSERRMNRAINGWRKVKRAAAALLRRIERLEQEIAAAQDEEVSHGL